MFFSINSLLQCIYVHCTCTLYGAGLAREIIFPRHVDADEVVFKSMIYIAINIAISNKTKNVVAETLSQLKIMLIKCWISNLRVSLYSRRTFSQF